MHISNFMMRDAVGSLFAVLVFATVLCLPGYLTGIATDLFAFRRMKFAEQSLWAIAFSFCVTPIAAHLTGRIWGLQGVCWTIALSATAGLLALLLNSSLSSWSRRDKLITVAIIGAWVVLVLLLLVDFQVGRKLYYSVVMADQSYRIAFTDAVVRTGIPPANPLYLAGSAAPMRYYYFWYVLCAVVVKLGHVSARQAFIASSVWAALGLTVAVRLYATDFFRWQKKTTWIAIGLLLVTGADILPALGNLFLQSSINGNSEWWSVDQIDAWPDSILWVPHHVASVLCCLFAFLLLWKLRAMPKPSRPWSVVFIAGAACASAFGLSVYVAFGFALVMLAWLGRMLVTRQKERVMWFRFAGASAVLSALLLLPFLWELLSQPAILGTAQPSASQTHVLHFSVRPLIDSGLLTSLPVFASLDQAHPWLFDQFVRLLLLAPGLAMELGVYAAVLVFLLLERRRRGASHPDEAVDAALYLSIAGLLITTFLSSSVITNNDFGYRAVMLPQFFLTLLAAGVIGGWSAPDARPILTYTPLRKRVLNALFVLGALGTIYWAVLLRAWLPITASQTSSGFALSPEDAFQVREGFEKFDHAVPKNAVIAFRDMDLDFERKDMEVMTPTEFFQRMLVMNIGRQILNAEPKCATHFGGNPNPCTEMRQATQALYVSPLPSASQAQQYCSRFGVQYLLFSARDPGWSSPSGWAIDLPVIASEPRLKVLQCGM